MSLIRKQFVGNESTLIECWIFIVRNTNGIDEFWFKGADIAEFFYENAQHAIQNNVDCELRRPWSELKDGSSTATHMTSQPGDVITPSHWQPHTIFIFEAGLYALVLNSKKPEAIAFQKWVMSEVLPSLRRTGGYAVGESEPMDTGAAPSANVKLLQKDMEIQKLNFEKQLLASKLENQSKDITHVEKEKDHQLREAQLLAENDKLDLHFRYAFQTESAKLLGRAAIDQYIQRKSEQEMRQLVKNEIDDKYRLIRNMDDINPLKVNNMGIVYHKRKNNYQIIRQQWGTTLKTYDCIQKTADSRLELLEPQKNKRRVNRETFVIGDMLPVAHATNIWTSFIHQTEPKLFGLMFVSSNWCTFSIMNEAELRKNYNYFATQRLAPCVSNASYYYYRNLFDELNLQNEEDCVERCLVHNIWQVRQQLVDYVQNNSFDSIEEASVSGREHSTALTFEELAASSIDQNTVAVYQAVDQQFPKDAETLQLRRICEQEQLIPVSPSSRVLQYRAIKAAAATTATADTFVDSTAAAVLNQNYKIEEQAPPQPYIVQVPNTPQHPSSSMSQINDNMSIMSVDSTKANLSRYFNDLTSIRQTNVDKYTK